MCVSGSLDRGLSIFSILPNFDYQPTNFEGAIPSTTSNRAPSQTDFRTAPRLPPHRQHFNLVSRAHSGGLSRRRRPGTGSRRPSHRTVIDSGSRPGLTFLRRLPSPTPRLTGQDCWHHFLHEIVCDLGFQDPVSVWCGRDRGPGRANRFLNPLSPTPFTTTFFS